MVWTEKEDVLTRDILVSAFVSLLCVPLTDSSFLLNEAEHAIMK